MPGRPPAALSASWILSRQGSAPLPCSVRVLTAVPTIVGGALRADVSCRETASSTKAEGRDLSTYAAWGDLLSEQGRSA